MFGRKRKQEAAAAAETRRRKRQELRERAKVEHAACDAVAHEEYERLPAAGATKCCTKCGETNLARTLRGDAMITRHTAGCAQASNVTFTDRIGLPLAEYPHQPWSFEVLNVTCRSCGADVAQERPLDVVRMHESFAHRNGMGIPVHEEASNDD